MLIDLILTASEERAEVGAFASALNAIRLGNLLIMAQAGLLNHADTVDSLTLMAKEILPRLKEYKQPTVAPQVAAE